MLKIGGSHRMRKALFVRGLRQGYLNVEEVEAAVPPGTMSAAERWLLYFSLRASEVELRDADGHILTPDDLVPEHRRARQAAVRQRAKAAEAKAEGTGR